jgi:hypothetical protein
MGPLRFQLPSSPLSRTLLEAFPEAPLIPFEAFPSNAASDTSLRHTCLFAVRSAFRSPIHMSGCPDSLQVRFPRNVDLKAFTPHPSPLLTMQPLLATCARCSLGLRSSPGFSPSWSSLRSDSEESSLRFRFQLPEDNLLSTDSARLPWTSLYCIVSLPKELHPQYCRPSEDSTLSLASVPCLGHCPRLPKHSFFASATLCCAPRRSAEHSAGHWLSKNSQCKPTLQSKP